MCFGETVLLIDDSNDEGEAFNGIEGIVLSGSFVRELLDEAAGTFLGVCFTTSSSSSFSSFSSFLSSPISISSSLTCGVATVIDVHIL